MRYKILKVSPYIFINLCIRGGKEVRVVANSLPEDSKFVRAYTDDNLGWGSIGLVIESQSFPELKEGDVIEVLPHPMFENVG